MRARNIKPGFYHNEELVALPFETRLLFPGLWMMADREGRLEDRPLKIKMEIFPGDNLDIESMLQQLHDAGFIIRYQIGGKRYIQIVNFLKHQTPHYSEKASTIPPYSPPDSENILGNILDESGSDCGDLQNQNPLNPESRILNPESRILNPECSPIGDSIAAHDGAAPPPSTPPCDHAAIIEIYHHELPELPKVRRWGEENRKHLRARWREDPKRQNLDWWREYFRQVASTSFLTGHNDRGWTANLEWLVRASNMAKVLNGTYQVREPPLKGKLTQRGAHNVAVAEAWLKERANDAGS